ncbi:ATP-binding protein [Clostridium paridis]|uniref:histidine kinase n=1 Tax=Clostridium paridis TaxID=2803863 RepID=A0A937K4L6_9CLOT|nr:ATP-binding protein [Clostridium paridis]MBL4932009.1 HAMP domain-containing histidine kinase [Clostridium paridis]
MKISLMKKLSIAIVIAILGSIVLTSFISNYFVSRKFQEYLIDEHKTKENEAIKMIEGLYTDQNTIKNKGEIQRYAELQTMFIEVKDLNDNILYSSGSNYLKGNGRMKNMMGSIMNNFSGMNLNDYTENKYPLTVNSKNVGSITIGYFGTSFITSGSVDFISALNHSFLLSGFIALIFALIISVIISKGISKPIKNITDIANNMREGNLDIRSQTNTNTKEINDLSNSINYLAETLSHQEMLRKRLTSDISHELRTPLTTLKTHIEAFIDGIWEPTPERFNAFYNEIERLTKLVDNLRNLSKYEQENLKLNISRVNLSKELEKIIDSFTPMYNKENYALVSTLSPDIFAYVDSDKFTQIMTNLLSNSFRYLKKDGLVKVILDKVKDNIIIQIIDNGIGISEKDLPHIFERFYRSDISRAKNTGGSGIGLTITKALVEAHGGKVSVESKEGNGTTFTLVFPSE